MADPTGGSGDLYHSIRARFVEQGSTLGAWCRKNKLNYNHVRNALTGITNHEKAREIRQRLVKEVEQ